MRIGSRQAPQTQSPVSRFRPSAEDFGAGVATALGSLGGAIGGYGLTQAALLDAAREREDSMRRSQQQVGLIQWEGEQRRGLAQLRTEAPPGAPNLTNQTYEQLGISFEQLADNLGMTAEDREHWAPRFEQFRQTSVTESFAVEYERANEELVRGINAVVQEARQDVHLRPQTFGEWQAEIASLIEGSDLPPLAQRELLEQAQQALAGTLYSASVRDALSLTTPVGEADGRDVVAPGTPAVARGFLNATHSVESAGGGNAYNIIYGGDNFESYADHPRQARRITSGPNAGRTSTAAGRYQFLASTWDFVRQQMEAEGYDFGVEAFSPVNQDRAAWWYAQYRYGRAARAQGLAPELQDLETALSSNNPEAFATVRWILSGESGNGVAWEGLQNMTNEEFMRAVQQNTARGAVGTPDTPNVWEDPRFASLTFEQRLEFDALGSRAERENREARVAAQRQREQEMMDDIRRMHSLGGGQEAHSHFLQAVQAGLITRADHIETGMRLGSEYQAGVTAVSEQAGRRSAGLPATPDDREALNLAAQTSGLLAGLRGRSPEAAAQLVDNLRVDAAIPSVAMEAMFAQLHSTEPSQQLYALELLADLYDINPRAVLEGLSPERATDATMANVLARFTNNAAAFVDEWNLMRGPEGAQFRETRIRQADELLEGYEATTFFEAMTTRFQRSEFVNRILGGQAVRMPGIDQLPRFDESGRQLFRHYFSIFGDETQAMEATVERLAYSFTPSPATGRLTEWSPSSPIMRVPQLNGSHDWINDYARSFLDGFLDTQRSALTALGAAEDEVDRFLADEYNFTEFEYIPDARTMQDLQQNGAPSYLIGYTDRNGIPRTLYDNEMRPVRIPMTPPELEVEAAQTTSQLLNMTERLRRAQGESDLLERNLTMAGPDAELLRMPTAEGSGRLTREQQQERLESMRRVVSIETQRLQQSVIGQLQEQSTESLIRIRRQLISAAGGSAQETPSAFLGAMQPAVSFPMVGAVQTAVDVGRSLMLETNPAMRILQSINEELRRRANDE